MTATHAGTTALSRPIILQGIKDSLAKLDPRVQVRNPVMFVVYVGSIFTTALGFAGLFGLAASAGRPGFVLHVSAWLWLTVLFANFAEAVAEGRGKAQAAALRATRKEVQAKKLKGRDRAAGHGIVVGILAAARRRRAGGDRGRHPGGRRGHRRRCVGRRERDHRRVGPGAARVGRRLQLGDRRHARPVGLARRARHRQSRRGVPRPHDRHGRRRQARQDAQRNRALDPARVHDAGVPAGHGHARAVFAVRGGDGGRRHGSHGRRAHRAAGLPDSDHHRRPALGHRHRRHGPHGALQRDRDLRSRGGGGRRRGRAAARQDRHDHARGPPGIRLLSGPGREGTGTGRRRAAGVAGRRNPGRPLHRRAGEATLPAAWPGPREHRSPVPQVLGADPHERRGPRRPAPAQGRGRTPCASSSKRRAEPGPSR